MQEKYIFRNENRDKRDGKIGDNEDNDVRI